MNDLIVTSKNLPANVEDLSKFVLVGREKLVAVRAEIRAIEKVGLAEEVRLSQAVKNLSEIKASDNGVMYGCDDDNAIGFCD